jgi:hypothetical protein
LAVPEESDPSRIDRGQACEEAHFPLGVAGEGVDRRLARGLTRIRSSGLAHAALVVGEHRDPVECEESGEDVELIACARSRAVHHRDRRERTSSRWQRERRRVDPYPHFALTKCDPGELSSLPGEARSVRDDRAVSARVAEPHSDTQRRADPVRRPGRELDEEGHEPVGLEHPDGGPYCTSIHTEEGHDASEPSTKGEVPAQRALPNGARETHPLRLPVEDDVLRQAREGEAHAPAAQCQGDLCRARVSWAE